MKKAKKGEFRSSIKEKSLLAEAHMKQLTVTDMLQGSASKLSDEEMTKQKNPLPVWQPNRGD